MKAIRIYPVRHYSDGDGGHFTDECPVKDADAYGVYEVYGHLSGHLFDAATPADAAAAGRLLAKLYGVPLIDAHNLGEAP